MQIELFSSNLFLGFFEFFQPKSSSLTNHSYPLPCWGTPQGQRGSAGTCIELMPLKSIAYSRDAVLASANPQVCRPTNVTIACFRSYICKARYF